MNILIVNTSERQGGAAIAAHRLMDALQQLGHGVEMLVRDKHTDRCEVQSLPSDWRRKWHFLWERAVIWMYNRFRRQNLFAVDIANAGTDITQLRAFRKADVIHLHWVNQGMLSLADLRKILCSGKTVVWTMHDMWPCTSICHHARECNAYHTVCNHCPYLYGGGSACDLSTRVFRRKQQIYALAPISFVACSRWLRERAEQSALLRGHSVIDIPNPIDVNRFAPTDTLAARARLNLPAEKRLILFGSAKITDKRKGIDYFVESCRLLAASDPSLKETLGIVAYGRNSDELKDLLPFEVFSLEYIRSEEVLIDVYNAVDLFVTPSLEENLPNTIMETLSCGTPCVGFRVGGIPEMIDHQINGYVAQYMSAPDLANGIRWVLHSSHPQELAAQARLKVMQTYSPQVVAQRYVDLYQQSLAHE